MSRGEYEQVIRDLQRGNRDFAVARFDNLKQSEGGRNFANRVFYHVWIGRGCPMNGDARFGEHVFYDKNTSAETLCTAIRRAMADFAFAPSEIAQKPYVGESCAICLDVMTGQDQVAFCRRSCGNSVHVVCQRRWNAKNGRNDCVLCKRDRISGAAT